MTPDRPRQQNSESLDREQTLEMKASRLRQVAGRIVGEIAIIVVGVLIALYVDQWQDARAVASEADQYLSVVRDDVEEQVARLETALRWIENAVWAANQSLPFLDGRTDVGSDSLVLAAMLYQPTRLSIDNLSSPAFEALRSSDRLPLVANAELRRLLLQYFAEAARTQTLFEVLPHGYRDAVRSLMPPHLGLALREACPFAPSEPAACQPAVSVEPGSLAYLGDLYGNRTVAAELRYLATQMLHSVNGIDRQRQLGEVLLTELDARRR